mmetsp:Transcript_3427/g.12207  ORF Transcript_3427/g.12207 Transcript_3427/m.12207 type:complete len:320 (-) Transcript_3427:12-971(-)
MRKVRRRRLLAALAARRGPPRVGRGRQRGREHAKLFFHVLDVPRPDRPRGFGGVEHLQRPDPLDALLIELRPKRLAEHAAGLVDKRQHRVRRRDDVLRLLGQVIDARDLALVSGDRHSEFQSSVEDSKVGRVDVARHHTIIRFKVVELLDIRSPPLPDFLDGAGRVVLDGVGLVVVRRHDHVNYVRRELVPLQRAVCVHVYLREQLAQLRDEARIAHLLQLGVTRWLAVPVAGAHRGWRGAVAAEEARLHDVAELRHGEAVVPPPELLAQQPDLLCVQAHHDLGDERRVVVLRQQPATGRHGRRQDANAGSTNLSNARS